jgi:hypothetical protein
VSRKGHLYHSCRAFGCKWEVCGERKSVFDLASELLAHMTVMHWDLMVRMHDAVTSDDLPGAVADFVASLETSRDR